MCRFIEYSARDAISTFQVAQQLHDKLLPSQTWVVDDKVIGTMREFYSRYLLTFGDLLTDMERIGILIDENHLKEAEKRATEERDRMAELFMKWASNHCTDAAYINIASSSQIGMLLFGEYENGIVKETSKVFKIDKDDAEFLGETEKVLKLYDESKMLPKF